MTRADLLLYRRMRGVFWVLLVGLLLVVPSLLALGFAFTAQLELVSGRDYESIGTPEAAIGAGIGLAGFVALIGSVVLGATAGSVDHQRGVLRDLVLAGKARWRIVVGRLLAAAVWIVVFAVVTYALIVAIGVLLAPIDDPVDWGEVWRNVAMFTYPWLYTMPFAAGVALVVGGRGPAIAVFFAVAFVLDGVLSALPYIGEWWSHVSLLQSTTVIDGLFLDEGTTFDGEAWRAVAVIAAWAIVPLAIGIARLNRREL
jgi:ABC-type transport system involved in multi-copper enzyme maturation permease subunit